MAKKKVRTGGCRAQKGAVEVQEQLVEKETETVCAPKSRAALHDYVKTHLGLDVPDRAVCSGHDAPMDYLWHAYSADFAGLPEAVGAEDSADCIVWAGRGGGKTRLAAVATLLDSIFKPGCKTRILAGSLDQSSRMYEYFCDYALTDAYRPMLEGKVRVGRCRFGNRSDVGVLAHSPRDVRGIHIHKLRCDEAELFKEDVFRAAQFVTKTRDGIRGAMEIFSTMHQPYGVMQRLIDGTYQSKIRLLRWCVWEVIERCEGRTCSQCPLWSDCGGKAQQASGYLKIDDVIDQMRRSSRAAFESEMLCLRPRMDHAVFADFEMETHVRPVGYDPGLPLYLAMDFGCRSPYVCLWIQKDDAGVVRVLDEYLESNKELKVHAQEVLRRIPGGADSITATYCDPAGTQRNSVTGTSEITELARYGIQCTYHASRIVEGIELIRQVVKSGDGKSRLVIDPKCGRLIEAMRCYHYPANPSSELPEKDGVYDHPIDALRYFFVNCGRTKKARVMRI
jgi:hypothetical protein